MTKKLNFSPPAMYFCHFILVALNLSYWMI